MIIYPLIILIALVGIFVLVWRRSYFEDKGIKGDPFVQTIHDKIKNLNFELPHFEKMRFDQPRKSGVIRGKLEANLEKAEDLFSKKHYISAEKWYIEACKNDPKNPLIYSRLGAIYLDEKNFSDACDAFGEAIKLDEANSDNYYGLSVCKFNLGDKREALSAARSAQKLGENAKYDDWLEKLKSNYN